MNKYEQNVVNAAKLLARNGHLSLNKRLTKAKTAAQALRCYAEEVVARVMQEETP